MLTTLLALLSSSGIGSILGLVGGLLNRKIDIQAKKEDHAFELAKLDKQKEFLQLEYETRTAVASIEVESEGYKALSASYNFAAPGDSNGFVDSISKLIRPLLTLSFFCLSSYILYKITILIGDMENISDEQLFGLWKQCIEWVFFQSGVAIGWWFAMRPGKHPTFKN